MPSFSSPLLFIQACPLSPLPFFLFRHALFLLSPTSFYSGMLSFYSHLLFIQACPLSPLFFFLFRHALFLLSSSFYSGMPSFSSLLLFIQAWPLSPLSFFFLQPSISFSYYYFPLFATPSTFIYPPFNPHPSPFPLPSSFHTRQPVVSNKNGNCRSHSFLTFINNILIC